MAEISRNANRYAVPWPLIVIFLALMAGLVAGGILYFRHQRDSITLDKQAELAAIADLKLTQIANWRTERWVDGIHIQADPLLGGLVQRFLADPAGAPERTVLLQWMHSLLQSKKYDGICLLDAAGEIQLSTLLYLERAPQAHIQEDALQAMREKAITISDLHEHPGESSIHMATFVPIFAGGDSAKDPVGALMLHIDPYQFLYPLIQSWPMPSRTAETLLVRREGDEVVFLNELRHRKNTALALRFPLSEASLPAGMAARGIEGTVEGRDYRGVPVLAVIRAVPGTPWFMVAKVDQAEIYAPAAQTAVAVSLVVGLAILLAGASIGVVWRQQRVRFYRQQYEDALKRRQLEQQYAYLSEHANDIILLLDEKLNIIQANQRAAAAYGYPLEQLLTMPGRDLRAPECATTIEQDYRRVSEAGDGRWETVHRRRDGSVFPVEISSRRIDLDGHLAFLDIIRDITEQVEAKKTLEEERERLVVTLRSIGDGVISTDASGQILLMNEAAERLTGWSEAESIGRPLEEVFCIINEQTRRRCENPVERVLRSGRVVGLANHTALIARDGTERIIADSGAPIRSPNGQIIGVVLVFRDVTLQRKMEVELTRAQKLESLGILAGGIAHDFNNLLTAIVGNIGLARMYARAGKDIQEPLGDAERASMRARDLTQQLLAFAKGGTPVKKPALLGALVREAAGFALRGSSTRAEFSIAPDLWPAEMDEGQISQVIQNLVLNACQAMPSGGVVYVLAENVILAEGEVPPLPAGRYLKLSIRDEGEGIPPENLPKIFDPYFTTKPTGSGLGLSVAHSVVKNHDGQITVASQVGVGTTFCVYLPAAAEATVASAVAENGVVAGRGRILVMDDEDLIRHLADQLLSHLGYEVSLARDGQEALRLYEEALRAGRRFDVVIMDLTIPGGMGGQETLHRLRQLDPDVKALVSSGYSNDPVMAQYRQYGFCGVVVKPYQVEALGRVLQEVLSAPRRGE